MRSDISDELTFNLSKGCCSKGGMMAGKTLLMATMVFFFSGCVGIDFKKKKEQLRVDIDFSSLSTEQAIEKLKTEVRVDRKECKKWAEREERNLDWLNSLPDCPCALDIGKGKPRLPGYANSAIWLDVQKAPPSHPGGHWEIRSIVFDGHGQQCIYDNNGMLMIDGAAAGTPDRVNYLDKSGHARYDLAPWVLCGGDDEAYKTYNIGRPPNKGKGPNGEICGD